MSCVLNVTEVCFHPVPQQRVLMFAVVESQEAKIGVKHQMKRVKAISTALFVVCACSQRIRHVQRGSRVFNNATTTTATTATTATTTTAANFPERPSFISDFILVFAATLSLISANVQPSVKQERAQTRPPPLLQQQQQQQ